MPVSINEKMFTGGVISSPVSVIALPGSAGSLQLTSGDQAVVSVSTTPVIAKCGASNFANRIVLVIEPQDGVIYYGFNSGVTSSNGMPLEIKENQVIYASDSMDVYMVAASGTVNVRVLEGSDQ